MIVTQFVMAYRVEQDRLRAMLPPGFVSLRPVLRINAELRSHRDTEKTIYLEFNTPVAAHGKRGWLNIAHWESGSIPLSCEKDDSATSFHAPFLDISFLHTGITGGCPAEKDNDGCFFLGETISFVPSEKIDRNKELCLCSFAWKYNSESAHGMSVDSRSLPAVSSEPKRQYMKQSLTPEIAASIPCQQVLGAYTVTFPRKW